MAAKSNKEPALLNRDILIWAPIGFPPEPGTKVSIYFLLALSASFLGLRGFFYFLPLGESIRNFFPLGGFYVFGCSG